MYRQQKGGLKGGQISSIKTNHRLIKDYKKATAVKTGYTRAAGFNGAMIVEKRSDRIIVVVFGGKSTKTRNAEMIKLAKLGFRKLQK